MKTVLFAILEVTACAVAAVADDAKAPDTPKKNQVTYEYSYPPPTQKPPIEVKSAPLPRTSSMEWLRRVDQGDRSRMAPWEWRRMEAWRGQYSFVEPPAWRTDLNGW